MGSLALILHQLMQLLLQLSIAHGGLCAIILHLTFLGSLDLLGLKHHLVPHSAFFDGHGDD